MPRRRRPTTGLAALCGLVLAGLATLVAGGPVEAASRALQPQVAEPRATGAVVRLVPVRSVASVGPVAPGTTQLQAAPLPRVADDGAPDVPADVAAGHARPSREDDAPAPTAAAAPGSATRGAAARGPPTA